MFSFDKFTLVVFIWKILSNSFILVYVNQTARPYLYCFVELEVEAGEEAEGEEAHAQQVSKKDIIPGKKLQRLS